MLFVVVKSLNVKKRDVSIFSDYKQKFWIFYQLSDFLPQPWETSINYVMHFTIFSCLVDLVVSITVLLLLHVLVLEPLPLLSELRSFRTFGLSVNFSLLGIIPFRALCPSGPSALQGFMQMWTLPLVDLCSSGFFLLFRLRNFVNFLLFLKSSQASKA